MLIGVTEKITEILCILIVSMNRILDFIENVQLRRLKDILECSIGSGLDCQR